MTVSADWATLLHLKPSDFKRPSGLRFSIVQKLDRFISLVGSRPVVLSDYRPGDPKTHGQGLAIDTTWPGVPPLVVWNKARASRLFSGLGVYLNEMGAVSFHFDDRRERSPGEPAEWGAVLTHPLNADTGNHVRRTEYVGADVVLDMIKKKEFAVIMLLSACGYLIYRLTRR